MNFPEPPPVGTFTSRLVAEPVDGQVPVRLRATRLLLRVESKFVPLTVTDVPSGPIDGLKLVMVGTAAADTTAKEAALDAEPFGLVTPMVPVVAEPGTVATIVVAVLETTVRPRR